jgi:hypothetical protein
MKKLLAVQEHEFILLVKGETTGGCLWLLSIVTWLNICESLTVPSDSLAGFPWTSFVTGNQ